jgi:processing peptidase subunit beta
VAYKLNQKILSQICRRTVYSKVSPFRLDANVSEFQSTHTVLDSGANVASQYFTGNVASVSILIGAGSRHENSENHGTADIYRRAVHMTLENNEHKSQLAEIGGIVTSKTEREKIIITAQVQKQNVSKAIKLLSNAIQHPEINEEVLHNAQRQAHRDYDPTAPESIFEHLHDAAFLDDSLGRSIVGSESSVAKLHLNNVHDFKDTFCTGGRIAVSVVGNVPHSEIETAAQEGFQNIHPGTKEFFMMRNAPLRTKFFGSDKLIRFDQEHLAQVALAYETEGVNHVDQTILSIGSQILGSFDYLSGKGDKTGNRMSEQIAENELAHYSSAFNFPYSDIGMFGVYVVTTPNKLYNLSPIVTDNLLWLSESVSDYGFARGKMLAKQHLLGITTTSQQISETLGRQLLDHQKLISLQELFGLIDGVTKEDFMDTFNNIVHDRDHALAGYGNLHELPDYNWFRSHSYRVFS